MITFCRLVLGCVGSMALSSMLVAAEPLVTNLEVVRNLVIDRYRTDRVGVSPDQLEKLRQLSDDKALLEKCRAERLRLRREKRVADDEALRHSLLIIDDEVYARATQIITEKQFLLAKKILIQESYPLPTSIFNLQHRPKLKQLRIEPNQPTDELIQQLENRFLDRVRREWDELLLRVTTSIPEKSRQAFVDYLGNKFFPDMQARNETFDEAYYTKAHFARMLSALRVPTLSEELKISALQRNELELLAKELEVERDALTRGGLTAEQIGSGFERLGSRENQRVKEILTTDQKRTLLREFALNEFKADPGAFVDRPKLQQFLELTQDEIVKFKTTASEATADRDRRRAKSESETFAELCSYLEADQSENLRAAFQNIWDE